MKRSCSNKRRKRMRRTKTTKTRCVKETQESKTNKEEKYHPDVFNRIAIEAKLVELEHRGD